jgi:hypothetical protein
MDGMAGQIAMGIKDGRISSLHSLWSSQIVHLLHRLSTSYSIVYRIGIVYLLVNIENSFPPEHTYDTSRTTALVYLALVRNEPREV